MKATLRDETATGKSLHEITLEFPSELMTLRDIITERVTQEVASYNSNFPEYFNGLVAPSEAEITLNGYRQKNKHFIDTEKQVYVALDAFQKNGYFVLIDNMQSESLEQVVSLAHHPVISFIKLTPLVGG